MSVRLQSADIDFANAVKASKFARTERMNASYYGSLNARVNADRALRLAEYAEAYVRCIANAIIEHNVKSKGTP